MRLNLWLWVWLIILSGSPFSAQQLIINEVSQGPSGTKEYVELVVAGSPTCNGIPCMDLRNYIIDDNNGNHAAGSGTGIAPGCIRLANIPFWSCIPIGTIILFYNSGDVNPMVPPIDLSMTDNNCRLVIPISDCTLLERHPSLPASGSAAYPGSGFSSCGSWSEITMANGDDSFQVITPAGGMGHTVSWGNNSQNTVIYFSGGAGGNVIRNLNSTDNNPANQANWSMSPVAGNETPGIPNNPANASWINSMNNSCSALLSFSSALLSSTAACGCTGTANISASGAVGPYTYTWLPSGGHMASASGLCGGTHTVIASSFNGCTQTHTFQIVNPPNSVAASATSNSISCHGTATGNASVVASGGLPGYTYSWSPSGGNGPFAANLPAGVYTVTVKDLSNCQATATTAVIQPVFPITTALTRTNVSCSGSATGSASVSVSNGVAPYTYTWLPSGGNQPLAGNLSAGVYTLQVTDANLCQVSVTVPITQPAALHAQVSTRSLTCYGIPAGGATLTASGGSGSYSYAWTGLPQSSAVINGLSAGNYTAIITDVNSCTISITAAILQPPAPLSIHMSATATSCGMVNGQAQAQAAGGTPGYSYTWSHNSSSAQLLQSLQPGIYSVSVSDANNCLALSSVTILPSSNISFSVYPGPATCQGKSDGSAMVGVSVGPPPYQFSWSSGSPPGFVASGLAAGVYSVTVTDANTCSVMKSFTITQPPSLTLTVLKDDVSCFGQANGSATVIAAGGSPGYAYSWGNSGAVSPVRNNLAPGTYQVQVKDSKNCIAPGSVTIQQPGAALMVTLGKTDVDCFGLSSGALQAKVSGGTASYFYSWSNGSSLPLLSALPAGTYQLLVKDMNGCSATASATVNQPAQPLSAGSRLQHVTCYNGNDGAAFISAAGGNGNYSYDWLPAVSSTSAGSGLLAREYTVTVSDSRSCKTSVHFLLAQPPVFEVNVNPLKLCSNVKAVLSANTHGGTGPYTYKWNHVAQSSSTLAITATATTIYTVQAVDAKGCLSLADTALVKIPPPLILKAGNAGSVCAGQSALLLVTAEGGDGVPGYTWQPGGFKGSTYSVTPVASQVYTVIASDGCFTSATATTEVTYFPVPASHITYTSSGICPPVCITFSNLPVQSSSLISSYSWRFDNGEAITAPFPDHCFSTPGYHTAFIEYVTREGCHGSQTLRSFFIDSLPQADFRMDKEEADGIDPVVNFSDRSLRASAYHWFFNEEGYSQEKDPSFLFPTFGDKLIVLVVEDEKGCRDTAMRKLKIKPEFTFYAPNAFTPNHDGINDVFLPKGLGWNIARFTLSIFDRWGEHIFETRQYDQGWDGNVKGRPAQNGIYTWKAGVYDMFSKYHEFAGHVMIDAGVTVTE